MANMKLCDFYIASHLQLKLQECIINTSQPYDVMLRAYGDFGGAQSSRARTSMTTVDNLGSLRRD